MSENIRIYYGERYNYPHERRALKRFLWKMFDYYQNSDKLYYIIVEPSIQGGSPDLLLMNDCAMIIVDLKELTNAEIEECDRVQLHGNVNSVWKYHLPDGREIFMGDPYKEKNPYKQVRGYRFKFAAWLNDRNDGLFSKNISKKQVQDSIHAWVAISPGYDGNWQETIDLKGENIKFSSPPNNPWFKIVPLDSLSSEFDCAPLGEIQLSEKQINAIIEELGVKPLVNYREFMQEYPWLSPIFVTPPQLDKLVDRSVELDRLQSALEDSRITTIVIQGLPGSGKTALAARVVYDAKQRHFRVRWIDCREKPGLSLDSILVAFSTEVTGLNQSVIRDPDRPIHERIPLLCEFLNQRPTLIVFDDFHLLEDQKPISKFIDIADRFPNVKFLLTSSSRLQDFTWLPESFCTVDTHGIPLENFSEFIQIYTPNLFLSPEEYELVWNKLSGNPQALRLSIPLIRQYAWMADLTKLPPPDSEEFYITILGSLSEPAYELAEKLSVLRSNFTFPIIKYISGDDSQIPLNLTAELVDKYILAEIPNRSFNMVEFIRSYLYDNLTDRPRKDAHRIAGDCYANLADLTNDDASKIEYLIEAIYHYDIGGPQKQLLSRAEMAYELLCKVGDLDRAISVVKTARECAEKQENSRLVIHWFLRAAELTLQKEQRDLFAQNINAAIDLLPENYSKLNKQQFQTWKDIESQVRFLNSRNFYGMHNYPAALDQLELAIDAASKSSNDLIRAQSLSYIARIERQKGEYSQSEQHIKEALEIAEAQSDKPLIWGCLIHLGLIARANGDYQGAIDLFTRVYDDTKFFNDPKALQLALGNLGRTEMLAGDLESAEDKLRQALEISRDLHFSRGVRIQLTNLTETLIRSNRIKPAEEFLKESESKNQAANDRIGIAWNYKHRGQIMKIKGKIKEGDDFIHQGRAILDEIGNKEYLDDFDESLHQHQQIILGLDDGRKSQ